MATEKQINALHWLINRAGAQAGKTIHVTREEVERHLQGLDQQGINANFAEFTAQVSGSASRATARQIAIGRDLEEKIRLLGGVLAPLDWDGMTPREAYEEVGALISLKKHLQSNGATYRTSRQGDDRP